MRGTFSKNGYLSAKMIRVTGVVVIIGICLSLPVVVLGQVRSGAAFLKILPSVRYQGMGGTLTGAIDEMQAYYANPGATGFLREWQWSASYTKWFADIYNVSLNYAMQVRTPWSKRTRFALGINYQGVREFDSTRGAEAPVTASDVLAAASVGNPLTALSRNLSVGANVKYLRSDLVDFRASSFVFDVGTMYRSKQIRLNTGLLEYGIISAGVSMTNMGSPMVFKVEETPLPRTLRVGAAINLGTHNGLQIQLAGDYRNVRDEIGRFSFGSEVSWGYRFSFRTGYRFNKNLLSKFCFGLSLRLDDGSPLTRKAVLGRNKALRVDVADIESNEIFSQAYRGGLNHYTICPERFEFMSPESGDTLKPDRVELRWEVSPDPDLYDDVRYCLLVERTEGDTPKSAILKDFVREIKTSDYDVLLATDKYRPLLFLYEDSTFSIDEERNHVVHTVEHIPPGDYFWTVVAYDRDHHFRIAQDEIWRFHVTLPDVEIVDIQFEPSYWITESDTQGVVKVFVANSGRLIAKNVSIALFDAAPDAESVDDSLGAQPEAMFVETIPRLVPQQVDTLQTVWLTSAHGLHDLIASARIFDDFVQARPELDTTNNVMSKSFYTIPKGIIAIADTVDAFVLPVKAYDVPLVSRVFFDYNSAEVDSPYIQESDWLYTPLDTIASRLKKRPDVYASLHGFADSVSDEPLDLAKRRAESVRQALINLGVPPEQVPSDAIEWNFAKDKKITNNIGVKEERRNVNITTHRFGASGEEEISIIRPVPFRNVEEPPIPIPVKFGTTIKGVVPVQQGLLLLKSDTLAHPLDAGYAVSDVDSILWALMEVDTVWLWKTVDYSVVLTDTLNREFGTRKKQMYLRPKANTLPIVAGLAEFNNPQPYPIIPWEELFRELNVRLRHDRRLRFRFVGHACGISPRSVNNAFSRFRAQNLQKSFLDALELTKGNYPGRYRLILSHLDHQDPRGKGADEPFTIKLSEQGYLQSVEEYNLASYQKIGKLREKKLADAESETRLDPLLFERGDGKLTMEGDNDTPIGRQVNRRIQIEFYYPPQN